MLSNPQKALIKRGQRQASLTDAEYREVLQTVSGCTSSTDPRLGDRACDRILAYMEAIYWRKVETGELQHVCNGRAVFQKPRYWAEKNTREETSRDRYATAEINQQIDALEHELAEFGYGANYCAGIRRHVTQGAMDIRSLFAYRTALERTLKTKRPSKMEMAI